MQRQREFCFSESTVTCTIACGISQSGSYVRTGGNPLVLHLLDQILSIATAMGPLSQTQKGLCPGLKSCLNTLKYVVTGMLWHITSIGLEEKDSF